MRTRIKRVVFTVLLCVMVAAVLLLAGEIYVRCTKPYVDLYVLTGREPGLTVMAEWAKSDPYCAYVPKPTGNFELAGKTVNSQGFISTPEISRDKEKDEIRIAFFGGSSTAGTGKDLADKDTWPWKTAEKVQAGCPGRKVTFINAAVSGYTSFESYGRLWSRVRFYKPDIIVVNHAWNEMYYFTNKTCYSCREGFDLDTPKTFEVIRPIWLDPYIRWSQMFTRLRRKLSERSGEVGRKQELAETFDAEAVEVWRGNLQLFRESAKLQNVRLYVCKQAALIASNMADSDRARCRVEYHGFSIAAHIRAFDSIYRVIDDEIPAKDIVDLSNLSGRSELFYDQVHPTPAGTTAMADQVAAAILRDIPKPK